MTTYILYKHPEQYDTLAIVQYLHYIGKSNEPDTCIERLPPSLNIPLPSIYDMRNHKWWYGIENVIKFYENYSNIDNILEKAQEFKKNNPNYTIHKVGGI